MELLRDFGPHPICNRYLTAADAPEFTHPMVIGQCGACGLVQTLDPVPAAELVPAVDWIAYNEPEGHLDAVAETLASLPGLKPGAVCVGVSFKDDTLVARMQQRGFSTWRLEMERDLGITRKGCGVESIQARLDGARAAAITAQRGHADLVIARHILEHAHDLRGFIAAVRALAKPGGYVVFEVPDCTLAFDLKDITTLWEEHTVYFTPATFQGTVATGGAALVNFVIHPYPFENCLVGVTRTDANAMPTTMTRETLASEQSRARAFAASLSVRRDELRGYLADFRARHGKVAVLGAGHLACTWIHLVGLAEFIEFLADDNPHKQNHFLPGARLPIRGSASLLTENIKLCLLAVSPEAEPKVIARNCEFVERGGRIASIFPASRNALVIEKPA
ncbi:MAG: methyltransferase domain-containing protein [Verrucomicrobia bacterium]|nr:methyltransferase domain-containing protein [Verrucomicrobiota bacterium]